MNPDNCYVAIIDDEESVRRALHRLLASAGYASNTFGSGDAFLESLKQRTPSCAILDFHMSGMDGLEVLTRLKKIGAAVPVLVISGHEESETKPRALAAGAELYLQKPVEGDLLLVAIERLIAGKSPA